MDLYDIDLHGCTVKNVRADMVKGRVSITFETNLDEEIQSVRLKLALLSVNDSRIDLTISEHTPQLPLDFTGGHTDESNDEPDQNG